MRVILAGYNVDTEVLAACQGSSSDRAPAREEPLTPETISAAYARISRNPTPVDQLRRQAREDVAKARASNEQIVYGFGHASVAEHAVFNFDLLGLSRLTIEAVEHSRLCSYTEKSQRYIRLRDDHVVPQELSEAGLAADFAELVALQNRTYHLLYEKLREYVCAQHAELARDKAQRRTLEGWAKEDARYVTSLATEGQLGMTLNARNLEAMIRRLAGHPLAEARQLAVALQAPAAEVAPSLIRHVDPRHDPTAEEALYALAAEALEHEVVHTLPGAEGAVQLTQATADGDLLVVAALLHSVSRAPWTACRAQVASMSQEQRAQILRAALQPMGPHDAAPRCFELVDCQFDLVLSAACFGQLKRHRMATLLVQPYDPSLGFTVPEAVSAIGMVDHFAGVMNESARFYEHALDRCGPEVAEYALTQAHRRRVLVRLNGRELYHFSRLRQDAHAQWDIRNLANRMLYLARQELPLTLMLTAGKDAFAGARSALYGDLA